ncbi:MAG: carboxypeptidase-like regulatory domain-containing protein [Candidatus Thiodiazotropha sp.]
MALQYVADFNKTCQTPPQPAAAGAISGTVTNSGGTGIGWAKVATSDGAYSTLATATGSYELSSVTPGSYTLVATLDGYEGTSQSITVVDGQTLSTDLVLTPLPVPATVAGVVSDTNETPLEGASIASADGILSTTSGADGSYALTNVAEGSINLIAVKPGYTGVTQAVTVTAGQNLAQNFVLPAAVEICTDGVDNNANGLIRRAAAMPVARRLLLKSVETAWTTMPTA